MRNKCVLKNQFQMQLFKTHTYFNESTTWFSEANALDLLLLYIRWVHYLSFKYTHQGAK